MGSEGWNVYIVWLRIVKLYVYIWIWCKCTNNLSEGISFQDNINFLHCIRIELILAASPTIISTDEWPSINSSRRGSRLFATVNWIIYHPKSARHCQSWNVEMAAKEMLICRKRQNNITFTDLLINKWGSFSFALPVQRDGDETVNRGGYGHPLYVGHSLAHPPTEDPSCNRENPN